MTLQLLQSLPKMSLFISIAVIVCMAISFAVLFFLYGKTKSKAVKFGVEDESLRRELTADLKKCKKSKTYTGMLAARKRRERVARIIIDAVFAIIILFIGASATFALVMRLKGGQVYLGDTTYLTVLTASMEDKNGDNAYLKEHDDGVRIHQYALIGIEKADPASLKEGDIIAFKFDENTVYVHRIVNIKNADGKLLFTTMGDNNSISAANETDISEDRIIGVFNGFHAGFLGVLLIYTRSDIGLVALIFIFLLLAVIDLSSGLVTRAYSKRLLVLAKQMDGGKHSGEKADNLDEYEYDDGYDYGDSYDYGGNDSYGYDGGDEYDPHFDDDYLSYGNLIDDGYDGDSYDDGYDTSDDDGFEPGEGFSDYADYDDGGDDYD